LDRAEEYRTLAAKCIHMAENVLDANYKTTLIHMATAWLHLADQVDIRAQSGGKRPTPEQLSNASC